MHCVERVSGIGCHHPLSRAGKANVLVDELECRNNLEVCICLDAPENGVQCRMSTHNL